MNDTEKHTAPVSPDRSPSYDPDACCGDDCFAIGTPGQPCWGPVGVVDEVSGEDGDYYWIHSCQGHRNTFDSNEPYKPEPKQ